MIRDRIGDEPRKGSLAADTATASVAYEYLAWATVWLLVGTVAGLIPAIKLNWPDFLAISWLSFGRVRPIHTSTVFWGWSTMELVGLAFFVVSRTSRAPVGRGVHLQLVLPRRILLAADSLCHCLSAFLPERRGERGDSGLLHAHGRGDVVHDVGARHHLLCVAARPRPSHLLVCARRA